MRTRLRLALVCGLALVFSPLWGFAGEEHPKGEHLNYRTSYAAAMLESRVRNVPIFFSRHKDF